jgi:hypothetical protein
MHAFTCVPYTICPVQVVCLLDQATDPNILVSTVESFSVTPQMMSWQETRAHPRFSCLRELMIRLWLAGICRGAHGGAGVRGAEVCAHRNNQVRASREHLEHAFGWPLLVTAASIQGERRNLCNLCGLEGVRCLCCKLVSCSLS